jgi:ADP-ribose pyrophosphatase YjhB (NUDIX family)
MRDHDRGHPGEGHAVKATEFTETPETMIRRIVREEVAALAEELEDIADVGGIYEDETIRSAAFVVVRNVAETLLFRLKCDHSSVDLTWNGRDKYPAGQWKGVRRCNRCAHPVPEESQEGS